MNTSPETNPTDQAEGLIIDGETGEIISFNPPEVINFKGVSDPKALEEEFKHLAKIDPDSKKDYVELSEAIKTVGTARKHITTEEDDIKKPLNKWRTALIAKANELRKPFETLEAKLKAEKTRVDNIVQEKLEAQKKLWQNNLANIQKLANDVVYKAPEALGEHLALIEAVDLGSIDFGDLIEDAKAALANARASTEQGIAQEAERIKLAEERAEHDLKVAEDAAKLEAEQLKAAIIAAEDAAYMEDENRTIKAQMEEMKRTQEEEKEVEPGPAPMAGLKRQIAENNGSSPELGQHGIKRAAANLVAGAKERAIAKAAPPNNSDFDDEPAPVTPVISDDDLGNVNDFIAELNILITKAPIGFTNNNLSRAVDRVAQTLNNAAGYLIKVSKGGDA